MLKFFIVLNALLSLFFWWAFYIRYWQFRDLFDEGGRYYDGEEVHIIGGFGLAIPAVFFLIITLIMVYVFVKIKKIAIYDSIGNFDVIYSKNFRASR